MLQRLQTGVWQDVNKLEKNVRGEEYLQTVNLHAGNKPGLG